MEVRQLGRVTLSTLELLIAIAVVGTGVAAYAGLKGCPSLPNDRQAQSNLTNALTEASAIYQNNGQSFASLPKLVQTDAPEFIWLERRPVAPGAPSNGISYNPCIDGPACQVLVLANWTGASKPVCS